MTIDTSIREANRDTLQRAFAGITALDVDAIRAELADDLVLQLPYEEAVPDLGKDEFVGLLSGMFDMYQQFTITVVEIHDMTDPNRLVALYRSDCVGRHKDVHYANDYIGVFTFRDNKLTLWREYDNPLLVQASVAAFAS